MYLGIDSGSTTTKLVLADERGSVLARAVGPTGADCEAAAERLRADLDCRSTPAAVLATGYGRRRVTMADRVVTEITCHAAGVHRLLPDVRFIIDIGGQDSKAIRLDPDGAVEDFAMNDKCAAGTGRFLEVIAAKFAMSFDDLAAAATAGAAQPVPISSTCAIFAETEVISLLSEGRPKEAIVAGVHLALARRVATLAQHLAFDGPVAFSGGVALNPAMAAVLQRVLDLPVRACPDPQYTAALGAALLART